MDYFGIIKRLGLFSETPVKPQPSCRLPPVSAKSIKMPPSTRLVVTKPLVYSPSGYMSQVKANPGKTIDFKAPKSQVVKLQYFSQENSPQYSATSANPRSKVLFPKPSKTKKSTLSLLKEDFSGICAWSEKSIRHNDL